MANDIDVPTESNRVPRVKMRDAGNEVGLTILPRLQLLPKNVENFSLNDPKFIFKYL